jgi:putative peptidoglycan lipid II flippase
MKTSLVMAAFVVASFLLGLWRDILIAWRFGSGWMADALFVALMLPVFFENILGIALRDAVIPHLQRARSQAASAIRDGLSRLQASVWLAALSVSLLVGLGARLLLEVLVPGWTALQVDEALLAFRLGAALIAIQTVLYFQTAILNVNGRFVLPMWRTLLFNAGGIAALLLWADSVAMVVAGMLIGQFVLLVAQQPVVRPPEPISGGGRSASPGTTHFLVHFAPLLIATGAQQACVVVERLLGSLLDEGSIAQLSFAFRISTIPLTLFSLTFVALFYPAFTAAWVKGDKEFLPRLLRQGWGMTMVFLVPAAVLLAAQPGAVVALLLERGQFDAAQTAATAPLLAIYGAGLPGLGMALLGGRVLLAQGRGRAFMITAIASALLTVGLDLLLYEALGTLGLALAFTIGGWAQALGMAVLIGRLMPDVLRWVVPLRWVLAAMVTLAVLEWLPSPSDVLSLLGLCVASLVLHFALVGMLGERDIFDRAFWQIAGGTASASRIAS